MALGRGLAVVVIVGLAGLVPAAANTCQALQQRLARLDTADGGFGSAAETQRAEISRARAQMARFACGGGGAHPQCPQIEARHAEMTQNLARLEARTRRGGEGERATIRRQMADAGCNAPAAPVAQPAPRAPNLFEVLFGGGGGGEPRLQHIPNPPALMAALARPPRDFTPRPREQAEGSQSSSSRPPGRGSFRTLCVRTCDGYFWPISFTARRGSFERHAEVCRAQCPNQEVRLFVHRNAGEWSEDAVDVDGEPLRDMPGAFRFRTEFDSSCACRPRITEASIGERSEEDQAASTRGLRGGLDAERAPEPRADAGTPPGPIVSLVAHRATLAPLGQDGLRQGAGALVPAR